MRSRRWSWMFVLSLTSGCKTELDLMERTVTPASATSGARALSADGKLALDFGPGDLAKDEVITILTRRDRSDPMLASLVYELGPSGVQFADNVTITLTVDAEAGEVFAVANVDGAAPVVLADSTWDPATNTARAELEHFSFYAAVIVDESSSPSDGGTDDGGSDAGPAAAGECTFPSGRTCPIGAYCADDEGCNFCTCSADGALPRCTTASCAGMPGPAICQNSTECSGPYGYCAFDEGCAAPEARCVRVQNFCARPDITYCGCDGVTFTATCPDRPYAHAGACP